MESLEAIRSRIEAELEAFFAGKGLFVVEVQVLANGKIFVFADSPSNITIDECAEISRHLETFLETNHLVKENYTLEVSSPGMDAILKVPAQFNKQTGKEVDVVLKNGNKITGVLLSADEQGIVVNEVVKKKNITVKETRHELSFADIKTVKKYFNFKL
jgi:ribosome maturation factor RimP